MNLHKNTGTGSDTPPPRQEGMTREEPTVDWKATCEMLRETITRLQNTVAAAREETKKAQSELNEMWVDGRGTVWTRPTAWAYAQVCRVKDEQKETITRLEDRLEKMTEGYKRVEKHKHQLLHAVDEALTVYHTDLACGLIREWKARLTASEAREALAVGELRNIAQADTRDWDDPSDESFKAWAQSRARNMINVTLPPVKAIEVKQRWTRERPTKAGWYWLRAPKHGWRDSVVWIDRDGDGPESYCYMPDDDSTPVDEVDGSWQGPLTPGEE